MRYKSSSHHTLARPQQAVGHAATRCAPRQAIAHSGILVTLARFMSPNFLSVAHVEFLQCALLAEQYRFAQRAFGNTWPRPVNTVSVEQVLRYFYLRGMIHMGCDEWKLAVRCFWTCLTVPAEFVSAIVEEAWKKLVLVQCLLSERSVQGTSDSPLQLPSATPPCITRYLQTAASAAKKKQQQQQQSSSSSSSSSPETAGHDDVMAMLGGETSGGDSPEIQAIAVYMELVHAFKTGDRVKFTTIQRENRNVFEADGNLGIVNRCETELLYQHIFHLSRIYSVIALPHLASSLQLPALDVQDLLFHLSVEGRLDARVEDDGWVVFEEPPLSNQEGDLSLQQLVELTERIQKLDATVATSPRHQSAVKGSRALGPRGVEDV